MNSPCVLSFADMTKFKDGDEERKKAMSKHHVTHFATFAPSGMLHSFRNQRSQLDFEAQVYSSALIMTTAKFLIRCCSPK